MNDTLENFFTQSYSTLVQQNSAQTQKTIISFPFKLKEIWSYLQLPFDYKPNIIPFGSFLKDTCQYEHIPLILKRNTNLVLCTRIEMDTARYKPEHKGGRNGKKSSNPFTYTVYLNCIGELSLKATHQGSHSGDP